MPMSNTLLITNHCYLMTATLRVVLCSVSRRRDTWEATASLLVIRNQLSVIRNSDDFYRILILKAFFFFKPLKQLIICQLFHYQKESF